MILFGNFLLAASRILHILLMAYVWILIFRVIFSWVRIPSLYQVAVILYQLTEPVLKPIRKLVPPHKVGGIDVSPMICILIIVFVVVYPPVYARITRYEVGDDELYLQRGFLSITRMVVPLARIQNVDTTQGPVGKFLSLSTVVVHTAGGSATIPSLDDPVAEELRTRIAARARAARGDDHVHQ